MLIFVAQECEAAFDIYFGFTRLECIARSLSSADFGLLTFTN